MAQKKTKCENEMEKPLKAGRRFLLRLPHGADILEWLTDFCGRKKINCAGIEIIGATSLATIGYYDQKTHVYEKRSFDQEMEIVSCLGNVSLKDGKPFLHLHAVMGDTELKCWGGHVFPGSRVFAAEVRIEEFLGGSRVRLPDLATGLTLWCGE